MANTILFLSVNSSYSHSSLALPILHNACKELTNWQWLKEEITIQEDPGEIAVKLSEQNPDILACSLYIFNREAVLKILERFTQLSPNSKIILGGPECLGHNAKELLDKYSFIHTCFVGEAEEYLKEYLENYSPNQPRSIIPENKPAISENWHTSYPVCDEFFNTDKPFVQLETSRGCPMGCKYCTSCNNPLRVKDLASVKEELTLLKAKNVKDVRVLDRTFNLPQSRGVQLLELFRTQFPDIHFHLEFHPSFLDDELKEELKKANLNQLHLETGIQSLDANVQNAIGRKANKEAVLAGIKFLTSLKQFETHTDLIFGLPNQTFDSVLEDVATLLDIGVAEIQLEVLKVLPGTPLVKELDIYGIKHSPYAPYEVLATNNLSAKEILKLRSLSRILDLFYNHSVFFHTILAMNLTTKEKVEDFLTYLLNENVSFNTILNAKKGFSILQKYLSSNNLSNACGILSTSWIENGYPLDDLPFGKVEKCFEIPSNMKLYSGDAEILTSRETRLWQFNWENTCKIYAFNRKYKINAPGAIWINCN